MYYGISSRPRAGILISLTVKKHKISLMTRYQPINVNHVKTEKKCNFTLCNFFCVRTIKKESTETK